LPASVEPKTKKPSGAGRLGKPRKMSWLGRGSLGSGRMKWTESDRGRRLYWYRYRVRVIVRATGFYLTLH